MNKLGELRAAAGLTQTALAEKAGLSQQAISQLESGARRPKWDTAARIANALGVRPEQIWPTTPDLGRAAARHWLQEQAERQAAGD